MKDTDIMPFGKFKGKEMIDIPAKYLLWLDSVNGPYSAARANYKEVFEYIDDMKEVLLKEAGNE